MEAGRKLAGNSVLEAYRIEDKLVRVLADAVERRESNRGRHSRNCSIIISLIVALDCGDPQGH